MSERSGFGRDAIPEFGWKSGAAECSAAYILPVLKRLAAPFDGRRVLDIGCGNGVNAGKYLEWGCSVVGIDASAEGVEIARERHPGGRFENLPITDDVLEALDEAPFDIVSSTEVVEHLYNPQEWAAAAFNALRPGGVLVCSCPFHGYFKNLVLSLTGKWDGHHQPLVHGGHIKFWSRATLARLLTSVGFSEIRFAGAGRVPLLWKSMLLRALKPRGTTHRATGRTGSTRR
ncbi:MAG: class I SAM-dependent methyltransferase [Planctomycetota bacterium]